MATKTLETYENGVLVSTEEIEIPDRPYDEARRRELAPLDGEGMDAMRKAIDALAGFLVADLPPEYVAYAEKVNAIKATYPKPVK